MAVKERGELRPQGSFNLESEGLNCHFKAGTPSLSSQLYLAVLPCLYHFRKHANLSAKNSCLLTKY